MMSNDINMQDKYCGSRGRSVLSSTSIKTLRTNHFAQSTLRKVLCAKYFAQVLCAKYFAHSTMDTWAFSVCQKSGGDGGRFHFFISFLWIPYALRYTMKYDLQCIESARGGATPIRKSMTTPLNTHTQTHTHTHKQTNKQTHTHTHKHTHTHSDTHKHTHTHKHSVGPSPIDPSKDPY